MKSFNRARAIVSSSEIKYLSHRHSVRIRGNVCTTYPAVAGTLGRSHNCSTVLFSSQRERIHRLDAQVLLLKFPSKNISLDEKYWKRIIDVWSVWGNYYFTHNLRNYLYFKRMWELYCLIGWRVWHVTWCPLGSDKHIH